MLLAAFVVLARFSRLDGVNNDRGVGADIG